MALGWLWCHTPSLSHTIFHTPLCHTLSFTPSLTHPLSKLFHTHFLCHTTSLFHTLSFTHPLSHPALSHTIFDTPSFTHHIDTHHLWHTIFHTQLYVTASFTTPSFTHSFHTHHLSHTTLSHTTLFYFSILHHLLCLSFLPLPRYNIWCSLLEEVALWGYPVLWADLPRAPQRYCWGLSSSPSRATSRGEDRWAASWHRASIEYILSQTQYVNW